MDFLDANILVYAYDWSSPDKRKIAGDMLHCPDEHAVSTQVLAEFSNVMLHKMRTEPKEVSKALAALSDIRLIIPDLKLVQRAIEAHQGYGIHFYDGMIVAAAERAGCTRILSEDLNPGQTYFGVRVENPFQLATRRSRS